MTSRALPGRGRGTVALVTANTFEWDGRHRRAAATLARDGWSVVVVAMHAPHLPADELLPGGVVVRRPPLERRISAALPALVRWPAAGLLGLARDAEELPSGGSGLRAALRRGVESVAHRRRAEQWTEAVIAAAPRARVWVAGGLASLPVVAAAAQRTGGHYVIDVADLHGSTVRPTGVRRLVRRLLGRLPEREERRLFAGASALIAGTPALAAQIADRHAVDRPVVVMSTREPWRASEPLPRPAPLRYATGIGPEREVVLYQGAFGPDRGIELLLAALEQPALADRPITAVFLGFGPLEERLRSEATARPDRIVVRPPARSDELLEWTAGADVSFVGMPPVGEHERLAAPSRLFESVMAGVPAIVAGETWTARLVAAERLGVVVASWTAQDLAAAIAGFLARPFAEREGERRAIRRVALERLNWDVDGARLLALFQRFA